MAGPLRLLKETADLRIGFQSEDGQEEVEVLVRLCPLGQELDLDELRLRFDRLERLGLAGYKLGPQDGWWVVCTRSIVSDARQVEERFLLELFTDPLSRPRPPLD